MKNSMLLFAILSLVGFGLQSQAAIQLVTVQDFEFIPTTMTVNVGDTIKWTWVNGGHTTTSTTLPPGAEPWNSNINSTTTQFIYVVPVPGDYTYTCTIHPTLMSGTFTAVGITGIIPVLSGPFIEVSNSLLQDQLEVNYSISIPATVNISLYDMTGKVKSFTSAFHDAGEYSEMIAVGNLPKGMYFLSLETNDAVVTRKLVMQ